MGVSLFFIDFIEMARDISLGLKSLIPERLPYAMVSNHGWLWAWQSFYALAHIVGDAMASSRFFNEIKELFLNLQLNNFADTMKVENYDEICP